MLISELFLCFILCYKVWGFQIHVLSVGEINVSFPVTLITIAVDISGLIGGDLKRLFSINVYLYQFWKVDRFPSARKSFKGLLIRVMGAQS